MDLNRKGPQQDHFIPQLTLADVYQFDIPLPNEVSHKTVIRLWKGGGGGFIEWGIWGWKWKLCSLMHIIIWDSSQAALSKYTESS